MPGILYHVSFAEVVYRMIKVKLDKIDFFSGNLVPDLALDKKTSHFRIPASVEGFVIPDLKRAKKELLDVKSAMNIGIYCHLYLDYYFIEDFLIPSFIWDEANMMVINPQNQKSWTVEKFFAKPNKGGILCKGYTQINKELIRNGYVSMDTISMIPEELPLSGISTFDIRREKSWKKELDGYLEEEATYTGDILDYQKLCNFIDKTASKFVAEL